MLHEYLGGLGGICQHCGLSAEQCLGLHRMDLSFLQHPIEPAFLIPKNPFWTRPVLLGTMTQDGFFPVAEWRDAAQREYYAGWEAFDVALSQSSPRTLRVQQQCEITDLERLWRL